MNFTIKKLNQCAIASPHEDQRSVLRCEPSQRRSFVHCDVVGLQPLDLILRLIFACLNGVALELHRRRDDLDDAAAYPAGFRIPTDTVADLESSFHRLRTFQHRMESTLRASSHSKASDREQGNRRACRYKRLSLLIRHQFL